ncbi:ClpS-like protein [Athelia psychrophila]|uniref:ClpS-like protein n=1 Tax=Athelia psychrophila TaxID=1759441 RepID=A0A166DWR8_9AGAM|nr:ClpS-like protein [Fibularhizoctonia sp. CBS 109695]
MEYSHGYTSASHPRLTFSSASSRRHLATAVAADASSSTTPPPPATTSDPKIGRIVDDISALTLLQAADLVSLLKTRLNIQEIAMPSASAAPVAAAEEEAPAVTFVQEVVKEKTVFNVTLESFEGGSKPKIIREVKALVPNLTLIDAKKFVESLPKTLKENLSKEDADKMKATFEALGAIVKLD